MIVPAWAYDPDALQRLDSAVFHGRWEDRRWMGTPGPFYTGDADFALFGSLAAPSLVAIDDEKVDVFFRQPWSAAEIELATGAANLDFKHGYAADGNRHWTVDGVRDWWRRRTELRDHIEQHLLTDWYNWPSEWPLLRRLGIAWLRFLEHDAQLYLRQYCWFLDARQWPAADARLPDL